VIATGRDGHRPGTQGDIQRVSKDDALDAMTRKAAGDAASDKRSATIEVGSSAHLVVTDPPRFDEEAGRTSEYVLGDGSSFDREKTRR